MSGIRVYLIVNGGEGILLRAQGSGLRAQGTGFRD
jgi:hypothetical protein